MRTECAHIRPHCSLACSHLPGGAVTGERVLLVRHHGRIAHDCKEIVRLVVFADAALGCAVCGLFLAPMPLAAGPADLRTAVLLRLDAYAIKKRRVEFHDRTLCAFTGDAFKT